MFLRQQRLFPPWSYPLSLWLQETVWLGAQVCPSVLGAQVVWGRAWGWARLPGLKFHPGPLFYGLAGA